MIRKLEEKDYEQVKKLMEETHDLHYQNRSDIYEKDYIFTKEEWKMILASIPMLSFVYEEDNKIIGLVIAYKKWLGVSSSMLKKRSIYFIENIVVDKKYQKKGIGTKLYNHLKKKATEDKVDSIELCVWSFNETAIKFYNKLGLTVKNMKMEEKLEKR